MNSNNFIKKDDNSSSNLFKEAGFIKQIGHKDDIKDAIFLAEINQDGLIQYGNSSLDLFFKSLDDENTISYLDIRNIGNAETLNILSKKLNIHPLVLEDIQNNDTYTKMEDHVDFIFFTMRMFYINDNAKTPSDTIKSHKVSIILGSNYIISFQQNYNCFDEMQHRFLNSNSRIFSMGSDYFAYSLVDIIIDSYFSVIEYINNYSESISYEILNNFKESLFVDIMNVLKEASLIRKELIPILNTTIHLKNYESNLISSDIAVYLKDLHDHANQNLDSINYHKDNINYLIQLYNVQTNNKLNNIFKKLTIVSTIFIPLNFIAGFFGMNFTTIPLLTHPYGFFFVVSFLLIVASFTMLLLKKKNWF